MSIEKGRAFFRAHGMEARVREYPVSSATVQEAAIAAGVIPARIAKTLSFAWEESCILVVAAGDAKVSNRKFKAQFGKRPHMLKPDRVLELVGYPVGGVCPFGVDPTISVYLDVSLQRFQTVYPAVGSTNSAIELSLDELYTLACAKSWVDLCELPVQEAQ